MSDFNFDLLGESDVEWPKRGRKPKELPEPLVKALYRSFETDKPANMIIPSNQVTKFAALLSKAGKKFNMRIERYVQPDTPKEGFTTYNFRARAKANKDA